MISIKMKCLLTVFLASYASITYANSNDSIFIKENNNTIVLGVPVSDVTLYIEKANFKQSTAPREGSMSNPRYFYFTDSVTGISFSGWFEPSSSFQGVKELHPAKLQGISLAYKNINFIKVGDWDAVIYDTVFQSIATASINAHLVHGNTWVELHISGKTNGDLKEQHSIIQNLIKSIKVQVKP